MLHAYELGMLTGEQRQEFEIHLLECTSCNKRARQFMSAARALRENPRLREVARQTAEQPMDEIGQRSPGPLPSILRKNIWSVVVPSMLAAAAVFLILILKDWEVEIRPTQEAVAVENRLAIMYFDNIADPQDTKHLGEIVANLLIADLSESQYLQVVSSQRLYSIMQALGGEDPRIPEGELVSRVAQRARAELILTGAILQTEPRLEISAQLIEGFSGNVIASQRISGDTGGDIFSMVDLLSSEVKNDLALPTAARQEPDRRVAEVTTHSAEAYRHYLDGIAYYRKLYYGEATLSFGRAVELDSTFAMAYYYLAEIKEPDLILQAAKFIDRAGQREQFYIRSREALLAGNTDRAAAELQRLLQRYPDESDALFELGKLKFTGPDYNQSQRYFEQVLALDSAHKLAYNYLTYVWDYNKNYEKALWAINKYILLAPSEANPYDTRGDIYARQGRLDLACASYEKALTIRPDFYFSITKLGMMYLYRQEYDSALAWFQKYISMVGGNTIAEARLHLASIPLHQGKFHEALEILELGLKTERMECATPMAYPYHPLKYVQKCRILVEQGQPDRAVKEFEEYIKIYQRDFPDSVVDHLNIYVQLLTANNDSVRAREVAEGLRQQLEDHQKPLHPYWYAIGCIELAGGDPDNAVESFIKAMRHITDFKTYFMYARASQQAGRLDEAARAYEKLLLLYTQSREWELIWSVKTHYYLGRLYEQSGQIERAVEQYEEFLDIWKDADPGITEIEDAQTRLARLKIAS